MADIGTGSSLAFGTTPITVEYTSIEVSGMARESIDVSHLGTTDYKIFIPSKLRDGGEITCEGLLDPDQGDALLTKLGASAETITFTFPTPAGGAAGATLVVNGFMTSLEFGTPMEEEMPFSLTIKINGNPAPVFSDAT